jgi:hypothetical protein
LKRSLANATTASEQSRALQVFLAARTNEPPQAWIGRDPVAWRTAVAANATAPNLSVDDARALRELAATLDERAWARGDEAVDAAAIERVADQLLRGGL